MLGVLCILDNLFTYYLIQWPIYQEVGPLSELALKVPFGLWIQKFIVLGLMVIFRKNISVTFLIIITLLMIVVVVNNGFWTYQAVF